MAMCGFRAAGFIHGRTIGATSVLLSRSCDIPRADKAARVRQGAGGLVELAGFSSAKFPWQLSGGDAAAGILSRGPWALMRILFFALMDENPLVRWTKIRCVTILNETSFCGSVGAAHAKDHRFCHPLHTEAVYLSTKKSC